VNVFVQIKASDYSVSATHSDGLRIAGRICTDSTQSVNTPS